MVEPVAVHQGNSQWHGYSLTHSLTHSDEREWQVREKERGKYNKEGDKTVGPL